MKKVNWTTVAIVSIVALFVLMLGASLLGGGGYGGWWMMRTWMMSGMFFMWLIPVGFIVLTVLGVTWLVKALSSGNNPSMPAHTCSTCRRGVQVDWKNCPHCGATLVK